MHRKRLMTYARGTRSEREGSNIPAARNLRDERRLLLRHSSTNFRERFEKNLCQHFCSQIALRCQNERSHFRASDRLPLGYTISNALVSGYDDPVLLAARRQPFGVLSVLRKVIVVDLDVQSSFAQRACHLVTTKLAIEKESEFFRRLRRG